MLPSTKSKAEQQFAASQKKSEVALKEKEKEQLERVGHIANLRALRLAKEAADKKESDIVAAKKAVKVAAKIKKAS
jgi:hypothetical protein